MPNDPRERKITKTILEWVIGNEDSPTDAKNFRYGLHVIYNAMEDAGIDLAYDDAFFVRSGEGGEIILYTEIDEDD